MDKTLLGFFMGGLAGIGLGLFVGKCKIDRLEAERDALEAERDTLELRNKSLKSECEIQEMVNDNLRATNELFTNLLLQEKEE